MGDVNYVYRTKGILDHGTVYRSGCDGDDNASCTTALTAALCGTAGSVPATSPRPTNGRSTLQVGALFSGTTGTTAIVTCVLYRYDGTMLQAVGATPVTFTAGAYTTAASGSTRYLAPQAAFDLAGATHYELRCANPSSGSVDLYCWEC